MNKYLTTMVAKKTQRVQMFSIPNKDGILCYTRNDLHLNEVILQAFYLGKLYPKLHSI